MPDTEQLVVQLEARIREFEKNMQKAERTGSGSFTSIRKASAAATRQMETDMLRSTTRINQALATTETRVGAFGKAFGAGLKGAAIAGASALVLLAGAIAKTRDALEEFGNIADKSAQSGLDPEFFQEISYQASLAGVGMDELSGALNTFNKNSGLAVVNKGKMVAALKALNPELLANIRAAQTQEQRVKLVADAIDREADASRKAAIASAAFGDVGAKLVSVFAGGAAGIDEVAQKARKLGIIVNRDLIANADDLGDRFDTAAKVIDTQFKQTLIDLAPTLVKSAELAGDLAKAINLVVDSLRDVQNRSTSMLETNQGTNALQRLDIENRILELKRQETNGSISLMDRAELADLEARRDALVAEDKVITKIISKRNEERAANQSARQPLADLNDTVKANEDATTKAVEGIKSYADAIRALKDEIPALSEELAKMDAETKINAVYKAATQKATTMGEVYQANELRNQAMKSLDIKSATTDSSKYLSKYLSKDKTKQSVEGMQSQFAENLAKMLASAPKDVQDNTTIFSGYRSVERQQQLWQDALKKYGSVSEARKWVAPPGKSQHNEGNAADLRFGNDAARQWAHDNASQFGLSFPLGNEPWHVEDASARKKTDNDSATAKTQALEQQAASYDGIVAKAREYIAQQEVEAQAVTMTSEAAAKLKYETEMLNEARQAGITLNSTQMENLRALAAQMASAEEATKNLAQSQEDLRQRTEQFGEVAGGVAKGFVQDLVHGKSAAEALRNALSRILDQMLDSALSNLFGGGNQKGGGVFGQLLGSIFSGIGKNAKGTDNWRGGPTWVGEKGPEIINAPRGSQIVPNNHLFKPAAADRKPERRGKTDLNVHVYGANGDDHVRSLVDQGVSQALSSYDENQRRKGFGLTQTAYNSDKA